MRSVLTETSVCFIYSGPVGSLVFSGLQVYVQVNREAERDESVRSAAAEFYRRLVQREDQALALWTQFREITVDEYKRIYQVISCHVTFIHVCAHTTGRGNRMLDFCRNEYRKRAVCASDVWIFSQRLGVDFDHYSGESLHDGQTQNVLEELMTKRLLKTTEYQLFLPK